MWRRRRSAVAHAPARRPSPWLTPDGDDGGGRGLESLRQRSAAAVGRRKRNGTRVWSEDGMAGGAGLYSAASPTLNGQRLRSIGAGIRRLLGEISCLMRARPFSRVVPVLAHGPKWRPRHGLECGPCLALARRLPGRVVLRPCFFVSCLGRPSVPGPFGKD